MLDRRAKTLIRAVGASAQWWTGWCLPLARGLMGSSPALLYMDIDINIHMNIDRTRPALSDPSRTPSPIRVVQQKTMHFKRHDMICVRVCVWVCICAGL